MQEMNERIATPHIAPKEGTRIAKTVLMPGDPLRAKYVAENFLEDPVLFNDVRNMYGYTGTYEGKEISVMGSGMGMPSFVLYAHELYTIFGVDTILRIGSAGSLQDDVHVNDLVIAMSASTNSVMPSSYGLQGVIAPTGTYSLLREAVRFAEEKGVRTHVGTAYSSDYFYHPDPDINKKLRDTGHLCVEMETAGLYLEAMMHGKNALGIFTVSDHIFTGEALSAEERQTSFRDMMEVALKTVVHTEV